MIEEKSIYVRSDPGPRKASGRPALANDSCIDSVGLSERYLTQETEQLARLAALQAYSWERVRGRSRSEAIDTMRRYAAGILDQTSTLTHARSMSQNLQNLKEPLQLSEETMVKILDQCERHPCPPDLQEILVRNARALARNEAYAVCIALQLYETDSFPLFDECIYESIETAARRTCDYAPPRS